MRLAGLIHDETNAVSLPNIGGGGPAGLPGALVRFVFRSDGIGTSLTRIERHGARVDACELLSFASALG